MNKFFLFLLSTCIGIFCTAQNSGNEPVSLIPAPVSVSWNSGKFQLNGSTTIGVNNAELLAMTNRFTKQINQASGLNIQVSQNENPAQPISFVLDKSLQIPNEGYRLNVSGEKISLQAKDPAGIFYGIQTLLQLLPKEVENKKTNQGISWTIPAVNIEDHPRFGWRGLMLDVARHFFTKEEVKQFIDEMVKYKFNVLHWHLTDDQGWRIEIKSLPKLTSVGAWRVEKTGTFGTFSNPLPEEPKKYGGFYTQDDIREIVQYAAERQVDIMPEVDVPGHSMAAIAAYPEMTCTPGKYTVNAGERLMVWPGGGRHFYGLKDNALCPANEKVYEFLDKIFTEIAQLFPFEYIHMGGDETARNFWEKSAAVKSLMQKENLKNLDQVQSYFVKRVAKIIESKGKKMMGWDEIIDGGLAPNAAVMNWRGGDKGVQVSKMKHEVVVTTNTFVYIDLMQGDRFVEPPVYSQVLFNKTYQFEPVAPGADAAYIKGGQGNLWTEQIYNMRHAQYMAWPRTFAIAEILWSPKEKRNWNEFIGRVEDHFDRFDEADIKYSRAMYDPLFTVTKKGTTGVQVKMETQLDDLSIHYSFDNSFPDQYYPAYKEPIEVPKDASLMRVITYRDGKAVGKMISIPMTELKKRAGYK